MIFTGSRGLVESNPYKSLRRDCKKDFSTNVRQLPRGRTIEPPFHSLCAIFVASFQMKDARLLKDHGTVSHRRMYGDCNSSHI